MYRNRIQISTCFVAGLLDSSAAASNAATAEMTRKTRKPCTHAEAIFKEGKPLGALHLEKKV